MTSRTNPQDRLARTGAWLDVEPFRAMTTRVVAVRRNSGAAMVIGSNQQAHLFSSAALTAAGVAVIRRRSGGGAVLVGPSDPIWVDLWIPSADTLFDSDVRRSAYWVGRSWAAALADLGASSLEVHQGPIVRAPWSDVVCFAGVGPGEVLAAGRKVVGVAQWRCRQGSLFHSAAYRRWDPASLAELVGVRAAHGEAMTSQLRRAAIGVEELLGRSVSAEALQRALVRRLPAGDWEMLPES
jgi:lipoate-protein ligase A